MRRAVFLLLVLALTLAAASAPFSSASAARSSNSAGSQEDQVRLSFEKILDLWRDEKFAELYDLTYEGAKETREGFVRRMAGAPHRPACCWEKLQEVKVSFKSDYNATLKGRVGLEGPGNTEYKSKSFKLRNDDGVWRISRSDLFSLAEAGRKKRHSRRHKVADRYQ